MGKLIVATFLLLGWGFYIMSGGSDFQPETWSDQTAQANTDTISSDDGTVTIEVTRNDTSTLTAVAPEPAPQPSAPEIALVPVAVAPVIAAESSSLDLRAVAGTRVNMREGPGTNFGVIDTLTGGTEAEVIEVNADGWARIRLIGTNQTGWMAERLLNPI